MLLRVIAHQIACFASDRRALTVFCVTSVHFNLYAAFLLFAGARAAPADCAARGVRRVTSPAPPRQAPAPHAHDPLRPTASPPQRTVGLFSMLSFLTLFTRGVSSTLCETLFSAYSPPLFVTTVQHRHDVKNTSTAPLAPSYYAMYYAPLEAPLQFVDSCVYAVGGAYAETCVYARGCVYTPAAYTHQALA